MGRVSAFAHPEVIKLATESFVPVTADDWYQRRRMDDEGKFFIKVANQGPRKGENGQTRQGIYCLTADGELLEFKNAGQHAEVTLEQMQRALRKFNELPVNRRQPGVIEIPEHGTKDKNYSRTVPEDCVVIRVNGRILDKKGELFEKASCDTKGGDMASRDYLWLTKEDVSALSPEGRKTGDVIDVPQKIAMRIARFHLIDNTRGEPDFWKKEEVRKVDMKLTVTKVNADSVELALVGNVLNCDKADPDRLSPDLSKRGYDCKLNGVMTYDFTRKTISQFEAVAIGEHWGASMFTKIGVRPGKTIFGVAFGLADMKKPSDKIPPQAARDLNGYLGKE